MGTPKSAAGDREILLIPQLANILRRWREECPTGELVFPNGAGNVENHSNIYRRGWCDAQIKVGMLKQRKDKEGNQLFDENGNPLMGAKYNFHACRHFFASIMIEQNHLPKRVQSMLGHSSLAMTYDRYGHLFEASEDERAKMEKAGGFLVGTKVA